MTVTTAVPALTEEFCLKEFGWTLGEFETIRKMYMKNLNHDEIKVFGYVCKQTGLNPMLKQIYAIVRQTKNGPVMGIQTAIDGYRLIAEKTGKYSPGRETTYKYTQESHLFSATAYVKKMTDDGTWHEVAATAVLSEYMPSYANDFWTTKRHIMLAKCAEALALRKAFPAQLSAVYTKEEMYQAEMEDPDKMEETECEVTECKEGPAPSIPQTPEPTPTPHPKISAEDLIKLKELFEMTDADFKKNFLKSIKEAFGMNSLDDMTTNYLNSAKSKIGLNIEKNHRHLQAR